MKGFNAISRLALTTMMVCMVAFVFGQGSTKPPVKKHEVINGKAQLETILDLQVTNGSFVFKIDSKDLYKKGKELNNTMVEICATCDWKLSYDVQGPNVVDLGGGKFKIKDSESGGKHTLPNHLIGFMAKPAASAAAFYNANIKNHYATTKPLKKWDLILEPKNGKSNIGEESDTKFTFWWSLGQSWTGTNLLDEQIHAGWYMFDVKLTLSCVH